MRGYAAASISLCVAFAAIGCSGESDHAPILGFGGANARAGNGGVSAGGRTASAGQAGENSAGADDAGAGNAATEGGSAGASESLAGADSGGSSESGGSGGMPPVATVPHAPSELVLHVLNASSVQLSWTDNANNETSYDVYWSTSTQKPSAPNATLPADAVTTLVDGLSEGQEYEFWVEAKNEVGRSPAIDGKATPLPVPAQPMALTIAAGATDAVLTWTDAATTETGYRVYVATANVQPSVARYELPADSTELSLSSADINPYTQYYYWVAAYNSVGNSAPATASATTGVLPNAPSSVSVNVDSVWNVLVSWIDNSTNTAKYDIYWSTEDVMPAQPGATVSGTESSYKMTQKYGDQTYYFWVRSENAIGTSAATKGVATKKTYDLVWTDLYYDLTANTIRHAILDTFGLLSDPAPSGNSTALWGYHTSNQAQKGTPSSLTPGVTWNVANEGIDTSVTQYFWAEARTPLGSVYSLRSLVPPTPIAGFTATANNLTAALSWTASSNVQTYQLYRATGTPTTPAIFADAKLYSSPTTAPTLASPITLTDLNPGTPYSFWVRALGSGLNGTGLPTAFVNKTVTIAGAYVGPNLALGKTAVASSATADVASRAIDGNTGTRWQAGSANANEWIYINLGDGVTANFSHVKLVWHNAYAKTYDIEVCAASCDDSDPNPANWAWQLAYTTPAAQTLSGFPFYQMVSLTTPITGQFIRMKAKTLVGTAGASLYEFEAFSAP